MRVPGWNGRETAWRRRCTTCKARFYDRCDRWKKSSAIVAILIAHRFPFDRRSLGMKKPLNFNPKWRLRIKDSYLKLVIFSFSLLNWQIRWQIPFQKPNGTLFGCFWMSSLLQPDFWWISLQSLSIFCTCFNNICLTCWSINSENFFHENYSIE